MATVGSPAVNATVPSRSSATTTPKCVDSGCSERVVCATGTKASARSISLALRAPHLAAQPHTPLGKSCERVVYDVVARAPVAGEGLHHGGRRQGEDRADRSDDSRAADRCS